MIRSPSRPSTRVLIAHRLPLVNDALGRIAGSLGLDVIGCCIEGNEAQMQLRQTKPDLAVLGLDLDGVGGLDLLRERRASTTPATILICTDLEPRPLFTAVELGVDGLLLANAGLDTVHDCLSAVAEGRQWLDATAMKVVLERVTSRQTDPAPSLTRRERDVARLVAAGQRNRTIADALGISEGTVKMHRHNVYAKLGLESRTQLAMDQRARAA